MNEKQQILCHFLAVLAYRTDKALQSAPEHFGSFRAGPEVRTPRELLYHMSSLLHHTLVALAFGLGFWVNAALIVVGAGLLGAVLYERRPSRA